jgi:hypothetical protein
VTTPAATIPTATTPSPRTSAPRLSSGGGGSSVGKQTSIFQYFKAKKRPLSDNDGTGKLVFSDENVIKGAVTEKQETTKAKRPLLLLQYKNEEMEKFQGFGREQEKVREQPAAAYFSDKEEDNFVDGPWFNVGCATSPPPPRDDAGFFFDLEELEGRVAKEQVKHYRCDSYD